jgi:hypothetical protein
MRISVQTVPAISEYQCHSGILNLIPKAFGTGIWNLKSRFSQVLAFSRLFRKARDTISRQWPGEHRTQNSDYSEQALRLSKNFICLNDRSWQ